MADNSMQIVLELVNNASAEFKKFNAEAIQQVKNLEKQTLDSSKKTDEAAKNSNKNILRLSLTLASVIQAYRILSNQILKTIAVGRDMDSSFNRAMNEFELSILNVQQALATKLIPYIKTAAEFWTKFLNQNVGGSGGFTRDLKEAEAGLDQLRVKLERLENSGKDAFDAISGGKRVKGETKAQIEEQIQMQERLIATLKKQADAEVAVSQAQSNQALLRATQTLREYSDELKNNQTLFLTGAIAEEEYFRRTLESQNSIIEQNRVMQASIVELASLKAMVANEELMTKKNQMDEEIELLRHYQETHQQAYQGIASFAVAASSAFQQSFSSSFTSVVMGTKKVSEGFKEMGNNMLQAIVSYFAKIMAGKIALFILEKTLMAGSLAAGKAAMVATTTAGVKTGGALTAAYTPAAIAANIMSFGGAALAAASTFPMAAVSYASSLGAATLAAQGLSGAMGGGGTVSGNRSIEVEMLSVSPQAKGGDYMVNKPTLFLAGEAGPERATFTPIGKTGGGGDGIGEVNIYIQGGVRPDGRSVESLAETLGFEFARQVRVARG